MHTSDYDEIMVEVHRVLGSAAGSVFADLHEAEMREAIGDLLGCMPENMSKRLQAEPTYVGP